MYVVVESCCLLYLLYTHSHCIWGIERKTVTSRLPWLPVTSHTGILYFRWSIWQTVSFVS